MTVTREIGSAASYAIKILRMTGMRMSGSGALLLNNRASIYKILNRIRMTKRNLSKFNYLFLIIATLILAVIFYSGIVLGNDLTGRIIVGSLWLLLCVVWVTQYINKFVKHS